MLSISYSTTQSAVFLNSMQMTDETALLILMCVVNYHLVKCWTVLDLPKLEMTILEYSKNAVACANLS